ncbi:hypothetical protein HLK59_24285 [Streptomyces sp. S3(2020)]|uniref:hypothetical protein n=1 Tax=Streptomyces sp. S3(2020) TaxID=2732044 RepID=UPI001489B282|nr:hypothetical protein [Streptomyces sp. S3(2020)]NNN33422.1 hypothetical protein [Streptomyces sp. S3(2020)]
MFSFGFDHFGQGFGVVVGEVRAFEAVLGHGLEQGQGLVDLVVVQRDGGGEQQGGVADVVWPEQAVQGDRGAADAEGPEAFAAVPCEPCDRDFRGPLQGFE